MPLCHNIIEAMSVGAIPILQHPELFYPKLEHGVNCIFFEDEKDLIFQIKEVLIMDSSIINNMIENVIEYYKTNLTPKAVVKKNQTSSSKLNRAYIVSEGNRFLKLEKRLCR